ncbi:MAG: hypothetical protein J6C10_06615 [Prevotella sp.]|nr:hypothetical protein [Prevotella sp.]
MKLVIEAERAARSLFNKQLPKTPISTIRSRNYRRNNKAVTFYLYFIYMSLFKDGRIRIKVNKGGWEKKKSTIGPEQCIEISRKMGYIYERGQLYEKSECRMGGDILMQAVIPTIRIQNGLPVKLGIHEGNKIDTHRERARLNHCLLQSINDKLKELGINGELKIVGKWQFHPNNELNNIYAVIYSYYINGQKIDQSMGEMKQNIVVIGEVISKIIEKFLKSKDNKEIIIIIGDAEELNKEENVVNISRSDFLEMFWTTYGENVELLDHDYKGYAFYDIIPDIKGYENLIVLPFALSLSSERVVPK